LIPTNDSRRRRAFTLVELLIVVAIIGILVSMLLPALGQARGLTRRTLCAGQLRQVHVAVTMYVQDNRDIYPCAQDPISTDPFYWLWMGRGWRHFVQPYFDTTINKDNPSILFCPEDAADPNKYESTSYAYSLAFYHDPAQINTATKAADTYTNPLPPRPQREVDVAYPERKLLIGEWTSNHQPLANDGGWWCWEGRRLFLLADGQVNYLAAADIRPARDGFPDVNLTQDGIKGRDQ
jgi:prepilin-type N-terminal cleavage/methylation domain-containing protein